jgi:hypothetical protein
MSGSRSPVLFRAWIVVSGLGIVLPLLTLLLKSCANDFQHLREKEKRDKAKERESTKWIDLRESAPFLAKIAWHRPWESATLRRLYYRAALLNAGVLVALLLWRSRLRRGLAAAQAWAREPSHRRARRVVLVTAVILVAAYQLKLPMGFFFPGISGWTFERRGSTLSSTPPDLPPPPPFAKQAILDQNARSLRREGYLVRPALFLHFKGGEVRAANYELTDLVFPEYVFGTLYEEARRPEAFMDVVRAGLRRRREGRAAFLPLWIAYPVHNPYMPVSYRDYPPPEDLEAVSFWRLAVRVERDGRIVPVGAEERRRLNVR